MKAKTKQLLRILDDYYQWMEKVKNFIKEETGDDIDIEINIVDSSKIEKRPLEDEFEILLRGNKKMN